MQPSLFWSAVRRHWIFLLTGAVLALVGGAGMWYISGPTHTATAVVTLIPPSSTTSGGEDTPTRGNPLFYLGGLNQARDLVLNRLRSSAVADSINEANPRNTFEVNQDPLSTGPIIVVTVSGPEPASVLRELAEVMEAVPTALSDLQGRLEVPGYARIQSLEVTSDAETALDVKSQARNAIVGFVAILALTFGLVALVVRRRISREESGMTDGPSEPQVALRRAVSADA